MLVHILAYQSTTAAWANISEMRDALSSRRSGLRRNDLPGSDVDTWIGRVPDLDMAGLDYWHSRANALARACLEEGNFRQAIDSARKEFGDGRIGLILGSSTSSIDRTEEAYQHLEDDKLSESFKQDVIHNPGALSVFVAHYLGIGGPSQLINTACSSSAKVFAAAARWLQADIVDAVLVGGCDALGLSVVHGFDALQLVSPNACKPLDRHRDGINIGEAAGYALLAKYPLATSTGIVLSGYGESSDAHHMSHPHPEGRGAHQAMELALGRGSVAPDHVGYINLHGTSSRVNDTIEAKVVSSLFPDSTLCSSTKGWTGHTLGAAGITEAIIAMDTLETGRAPVNLNLSELDPEISISVVTEDTSIQTRHVMTNSFGFGGNNCSLLFSEESTAHPAEAIRS